LAAGVAHFFFGGEKLARCTCLFKIWCEMSWSCLPSEDVEWSRKIYELVNSQHSAKVTGVALLLQPGYCVASYGDLKDCFRCNQAENPVASTTDTDYSLFVSKEATTLFEALESVVFVFTQKANDVIEWKPIIFQQNKYVVVKATECSCLAITKNRKQGIVLSQLAQGLLLVSHFKSPSVPNVSFFNIHKQIVHTYH